MTSSTRFRINAPSVVAESVDGEVLIINLENGTYYSSAGPGEAIWQLATAGSSRDEIVAGVGERFRGERDEIAAAVDELLQELVSEQLVVEGTPESNGVALEPCTSEPPAFTRPVLQKYTDMQELLILDPIHDVEDAGWPVRRTDPDQ